MAINVLFIFFVVPWVDLRFVIVAFPDLPLATNAIAYAITSAYSRNHTFEPKYSEIGGKYRTDIFNPLYISGSKMHALPR